MIEATFVVIGDDGDEQRIGPPEEPTGGDVVIYDETLYEEDPDNPGFPDKSKSVGSGHGVCVLTPSKVAMCTISLHFGGADSVTASGMLPYEGRIGDGVIPVTGGTGRFRNFHGEMEITVVNPHKYKVSG